ncbi:hypothetical protein [Methanobrevibacter filiformis]|uniref:Uncharacterized protein n=1 Tax=Methanobrevibacter filiformis TaxID=55758 RepID=A0A162FCV3_9EURY|nr:hypothetical protein [Methanobrevibacter filiformis]KZX11145.1 hypothetical protein MBFIL_15100 [Methanobrevibacter filiformis]
MTNLKVLKLIDLKSTTVIGTAVNFFIGLIVAIIAIIVLAVLAGANFSSFYVLLIVGFVFLNLLLSIICYFGGGFLINFLLKHIKDATFDLTEEGEFKNFSIISISIIVSLFTLIVYLIMYPIELSFLMLTLPSLSQISPSIVNSLGVLISTSRMLSLTIYTFVGSFILSVVGLFVYNNISKLTGGIKTELNKKDQGTIEIDSFNVARTSSIIGIVLGIVSFVLGILFILFSLLLTNATAFFSNPGSIIIALSGNIQLLLLFVVIGFVVSFFLIAIYCLIYNNISDKLDKITLKIRDAPIKPKKEDKKRDEQDKKAKRAKEKQDRKVRKEKDRKEKKNRKEKQEELKQKIQKKDENIELEEYNDSNNNHLKKDKLIEEEISEEKGIEGELTEQTKKGNKRKGLFSRKSKDKTEEDSEQEIQEQSAVESINNEQEQGVEEEPKADESRKQGKEEDSQDMEEQEEQTKQRTEQVNKESNSAKATNKPNKQTRRDKRRNRRNRRKRKAKK